MEDENYKAHENKKGKRDDEEYDREEEGDIS